MSGCSITDESYFIGLMSGTSLDGIDCVIIQTNGERVKTNSKQFSYYLEYDRAIKTKLFSLCSSSSLDLTDLLTTEKKLTEYHALAISNLLKQTGLSSEDISGIGFHGQTVFHKPELGITLQIGNGALLCELTKITVIDNLRKRDMAAGGQGAPILPLYHVALIRELCLKDYSVFQNIDNVCFLNIGGVANITYISDINYIDNTFHYTDVVAFDTGPGNALLNDWINSLTNNEYDNNGDISRKGKIDKQAINEWMKNDYFNQNPPKSLDRNTFSNVITYLQNNSFELEDGAATLLGFTVESIINSVKYFKDKKPKIWFICGGGRHNSYLMEQLTIGLKDSIVLPVEKYGWNGDMMEAEGMAYLAARCLRKLPLTLPSTTNSNYPVTGGSINYYT